MLSLFIAQLSLSEGRSPVLSEPVCSLVQEELWQARVLWELC